MDKNDMRSRFRNLGLTLKNKAKKSWKKAKGTISETILEEQLRQRFNLENPYKFIITDKLEEPTKVDKLLTYHAKRYDEDDVFVFFGDNEDEALEPGKYIQDLSTQAFYEIIDVASVMVPVQLKHKTHEVPATAVYCEPR